jgi:DNA replication and repair protein RecF
MITSLRLQHFRSYSDDSFEFSPSVNIIVGPNASGKTNLLEALLYVCRGNSYRAKDNELIQYVAPWARLDATLDNTTRVCKIERMSDLLTKKSFEINGKDLTRLNLSSSLPIVLFEPNHLQLLIGGPELRRAFLDDILEQTVAGFATTVRHYRRALAQRNALLKRDRSSNTAQLFAWNIRLSELGGTIADARLQLIQHMNERLSMLYDKLSRDKAQVALQYATRCSAEHYATSLLHKLETNTALDYERGFTTHGPHRDDLTLMLHDHDAKDVASRGETRTLLLVLKILEAQLLEEARDRRPILLLDDVFSELDGARRRALTQFLQNYQTFITTTDADVVVQHFTETANIIPLSIG